MPTQIQLRRGTATQNAGFTGLAGEPTVNTTNWSLHVHDGSNQGGHELLLADLSNLDAATSNLEVNDATVNGNLTVEGNATIKGNLTFGDAATDTVSFSADVDSNILPETTQTYALGSGTQEWSGVYAQDGYFTNSVDVSSALSVNTTAFTVDSSGNTAVTGTLTTNTIDGNNNAVSINSGTAGTTISGASLSINSAYTLPVADGNAGDFLRTDGSGAVTFQSVDTDSVSEGSTNLYYTDSRVDTYVSGGSLSAITTTGNGTIGGNLTVTGDFTVNGTTTTLNTATLDVEDLNITVAKGTTDSATANGAGVTIDLGTDGTATMTWNHAGQRVDFNKAVYFDTNATVNGNLAVNGTTNFGGNTSVNGHHLPSTDAAPDGSTGFDLGSPDLQWRHLYVSGSSVYLARRRMRIADNGTITVNTNDAEGYPEDADQTIATNQNVLATAAALSIALGSI